MPGMTIPFHPLKDKFVHGYRDWRGSNPVLLRPGTELCHSSPPPPQQPFAALTCIDPSKPLRIPFLLPAFTTSPWNELGKFAAHCVPRNIFPFILCLHHSSSKRPPHIWFQDLGSKQPAYLGLALFCGFHPISLSRGSNFQVCCLQQPLAPPSATILWPFGQVHDILPKSQWPGMQSAKQLYAGTREGSVLCFQPPYYNAIAFWQKQNLGLWSSENHL